MHARSALVALVAALALPLAACAGTGAQPDATSSPAASVQSVATPEPTASAEPSATPGSATQRVATENGLVSIEVPTAWSVEHGGERVDDAMWAETMLVRDADGGAMAWLSIGQGGDRGGFCGTEKDGMTVPDEDGMVPARIHLTETIQHDGASSVLVAATRSFEEFDGGGYDFHVGFLPEEPAEGLVPCLWYDDVATPSGFPVVTLGTPPVDLSGDRWAVDTFEAGEAYAQTEEFALLIEMMRSLELHP